MTPTGLDLIAAERSRQISEEGYDAAHDAGHADELALAASCYAIPQGLPDERRSRLWPWARVFWKPSMDRKRELVKAGALIVAALDALLAEEKAS